MGTRRGLPLAVAAAALVAAILAVLVLDADDDEEVTIAAVVEEAEGAAPREGTLAMPPRRAPAVTSATGVKTLSFGHAPDALPDWRQATGLVTDENGPVVGATVSWEVRHGTSCLVECGTTTTNERGRFAVATGHGEARMTVSKGSLRARAVRGGTGSFSRIVLVQWGSFAGRVVDEHGNGIPRAILLLEDRAPARPRHEHRTEDDGSFRVEGPAGTARVTVWRAGYEPKALDAAFSAGSDEPIVVGLERLQDSRVVEGVLRPDGGPWFTRVRLPGAPHDSGMGVDLDLDLAARRFRLEGAPPSISSVEVDAGGGYRSVPLRRLREHDGILEVEVPVPTPRTITGVVLDDGRPLEGARVDCDGVDDPRLPTRTGADGRFSLPVWDTESRMVEVTTTDDLVVRSPVRDEMVIEIPPSGRVRGQVTDREGQAIPGARVAAGDSTDEAGANGRFGLALAAGRHRLTASAVGFVPVESAPVDVSDGTVVEHDLVLDVGGTIFGRVVDEGRAPIAGATVRVYGGSPAPWLVDGVRSRPDGSWEARDVKGASFRVTVSADGYSETSVDGVEPDSCVPTFVLRRR